MALPGQRINDFCSLSTVSASVSALGVLLLSQAPQCNISLSHEEFLSNVSAVYHVEYFQSVLLTEKLYPSVLTYQHI